MGVREPFHSLAKYFPALRSEEQLLTHRCPKPLSEEFWYAYAEPVADFVTKALWFQEALACIGGTTPGAALRPTNGADYDFWRGKEIIDYLTTSCRFVLAIEENSEKLVRAWTFPSLLSVYGMMIAEDLVRDHTLHVCRCGTPFLSSAYQAKYCSDRCRRRYQKQDWRKKHADKRASEGRA
jgi:hypothetical protein